MEKIDAMTEKRKKELRKSILTILFELYDHQTGIKHHWEPINNEETKDKTA